MTALGDPAAAPPFFRNVVDVTSLPMLIELGFLDYFATFRRDGGKKERRYDTIKADIRRQSRPAKQPATRVEGENTGKADAGLYVSRIRNLHSAGPAS